MALALNRWNSECSQKWSRSLKEDSKTGVGLGAIKELLGTVAEGATLLRRKDKLPGEVRSTVELPVVLGQTQYTLGQQPQLLRVGQVELACQMDNLKLDGVHLCCERLGHFSWGVGCKPRDILSTCR